MDRSGAMPRRAWVEIRDQAGELLTTVPAWIDAGTVGADLPTFPPGTLGTIQLCTDEDEGGELDPAELAELPTARSFLIVEMG